MPVFLLKSMVKPSPETVRKLRSLSFTIGTVVSTLLSLTFANCMDVP